MARPEILLLNLSSQSYFKESYSSLLDSLFISAQLKGGDTASNAIQYLEANNPKSILVTDEGLTRRKNRAVLDKVVSYAHNGGLVVVGLHFSTFTSKDGIDNFFDIFGLPWRHGNYARSDFQFNPSCSLPTGVTSDSLPAPYSMKALHVNNARPPEKIFVPTPGFPNQDQAAVVGAKVGNGYLVYIGDINGEEGSNDVILSFLGLSHGNDEAKERSSHPFIDGYGAFQASSRKNIFRVLTDNMMLY